MAITVTEDWREKRLSISAPWNARKVYIVTGTTDSAAALAADDGTTAVPQVDTIFTSGSSLLCRGPQIIEHPGPDYWVVAADFAVPEKGSFDTQKTDPLDNPTEYYWEQVDVTEPTQVDIAGRVIMNSAGDIFSPPPSRTFTFDRLTVVRNEPWFDVAKARAFRNTVNEFGMTLGGVDIGSEACLCRTIIPAASYTADASFIRMKYVFDVAFDASLGPHPFQFRMQDVGRRGWYTGAGSVKYLGRLANDAKDPVDHDEYLKGDGTPKRTQIKVLDKNDAAQTPVTPPTGAANTPYDTEDYTATNGAFFRVYQRCYTANFLALGL